MKAAVSAIFVLLTTSFVFALQQAGNAPPSGKGSLDGFVIQLPNGEPVSGAQVALIELNVPVVAPPIGTAVGGPGLLGPGQAPGGNGLLIRS